MQPKERKNKMGLYQGEGWEGHSRQRECANLRQHCVQENGEINVRCKPPADAEQSGQEER